MTVIIFTPNTRKVRKGYSMLCHLEPFKLHNPKKNDAGKGQQEIFKLHIQKLQSFHVPRFDLVNAKLIDEVFMASNDRDHEH